MIVEANDQVVTVVDVKISGAEPTIACSSIAVIGSTDKVDHGTLSNHSFGTLVCLFGVLVLTPDALLLRRLSHLPDFSVVFFRFLFLTSCCIFILVVHDQSSIHRRVLSMSKLSVVAACIWGVSKFLITIALQTSSVGSVLVILAANPMFSALFSYFILEEVIKVRTILASIVCFAAILVIFVSEMQGATAKGAGHGGGAEVGGILCAIAATMALSLYLVLLRLGEKKYG